ncbi:MAG: ABC transporter permease [Geminicoccaceae bacterium]|nr:ABC transporter permease [Geminicoccaceae bacterium]MCS7266443.1 ABC transporter permease [Geminicoccaceae bacterium]MCX7630324.1 ABC transporter permease [Geminicoccaceae bacterium]MDW8126037.1 ABC transporter permease [Geminicoccaceae bacterium]
MLCVLALVCAFGPPLCRMLGLDGESIDLARRLAPPGPHAPLGTDELGRDLLVRLLEGGRISLAVGVGGALATTLLGTLLGVWAALARGTIDALVMRIGDVLLALPLLPLLVVLAALDPGELGLPAELDSTALEVGRIVLLVALFGWPATARLVRAGTLSLESAEFVRAARALGASPMWVARRHLVPNLAGPLGVAAALAAGQAILAESVLSFLGLGIRPPAASWGNMLSHAQEVMWQAPLLALWPGLAILLAVIAWNALGDALAERADPRARRR